MPEVSMPDLPAFRVVAPRADLKLDDFRLPDGSSMIGADSLLVPAARSFSMVINAATRIYSYRFDEAMRDNWVNARAMRRDAFLRGLIEERILPTINRRWQVEVDDAADPDQAEVRDGLTKLVNGIPYFGQFKRALLDAVWFGRSGCQWAYFKDPEREKLWGLSRWDPLHGDSVQFTFDGTPAILLDGMASSWYSFHGASTGPGGDIRPTDRGGQALVLQRPYWRDRFAIHVHMREKADYFEGELAGSVQGLGLRGLVYWAYTIRTDALSWMLAYMQAVGQMDLLVFNYPAGNAQAEAQQRVNAQQVIGKAAIICPRNPNGTWPAVEQISMNSNGLKALHDLISDYFDRHIERLIVGQSMSAGKDKGDGLGGTGRAEFARACVPVDGSEILTRDGFKKPHDVVVGEDVLAYDTETDACKWTPLLKNSFYQDAPVSRVDFGEGFTALCTPDHSWAIETLDGNRVLRKANEIVAHESVILAAPVKNKTLVFNYPAGNEASRIHQEKHAGMIKGACAVVRPRDPGEWPAVEQETAVECLPGWEYERALGGAPMMEDAGRTDVWCPTTKYGTWVMRQNGRVMITGNTKDEILVYDTNSLDETLTNDLLNPLKKYNYPWAEFPIRFKSVLPDLDALDKVRNGEVLIKNGVKIRVDEWREAAGFSRPEEGDEVIGGQPPPQPGMAPGGGMPGMGGPPAPGGGEIMPPEPPSGGMPGLPAAAQGVPPTPNSANPGGPHGHPNATRGRATPFNAPGGGAAASGPGMGGMGFPGGGNTHMPRWDKQTVGFMRFDRGFPSLYAKLACVMAPLTGEAAIRILELGNRIPDEDLADSGREDEPHVTVRYGLHGDDPSGACRILCGSGPAKVKLGKVSVFPGGEGKEYDVVKVDVECKQFKSLYRKLGVLPNTKTYSDYKPHATIAYVKKGTGEKYAKAFGSLDLDAVVTDVLYSTPDKVHTFISLSRDALPYARHDHRAPAGGMALSNKLYKGGAFAPSPQPEPAVYDTENETPPPESGQTHLNGEESRGESHPPTENLPSVHRPTDPEPPRPKPTPIPPPAHGGTAGEYEYKKVSDEMINEVNEYAKLGYSPKETNAGECGMIAQRVINSIKASGGNAKAGMPRVGPAHVWVVVNGRHFDVETPNGVDNPENLPFFRRNPEFLEDGWELSDDVFGPPRESYSRTPASYADASSSRTPTWYDPDGEGAVTDEAASSAIAELIGMMNDAAGYQESPGNHIAILSAVRSARRRGAAAPAEYRVDGGGREHRDSGPGGGQFTAQGNSGGESRSEERGVEPPAGPPDFESEDGGLSVPSSPDEAQAAALGLPPEAAHDRGLWGKVKTFAKTVYTRAWVWCVDNGPTVVKIAEEVLDTPADFRKFGYAPSVSGTAAPVTDPTKQRLEIGTHLALNIASKVLTYAINKFKERNRGRDGNQSTDVVAGPALGDRVGYRREQVGFMHYLKTDDQRNRDKDPELRHRRKGEVWQGPSGDFFRMQSRFPHPTPAPDPTVERPTPISRVPGSHVEPADYDAEDAPPAPLLVEPDSDVPVPTPAPAKPPAPPSETESGAQGRPKGAPDEPLPGPQVESSPAPRSEPATGNITPNPRDRIVDDTANAHTGYEKAKKKYDEAALVQKRLLAKIPLNPLNVNSSTADRLIYAEIERGKETLKALDARVRGAERKTNDLFYASVRPTLRYPARVERSPTPATHPDVIAPPRMSVHQEGVIARVHELAANIVSWQQPQRYRLGLSRDTRGEYIDDDNGNRLLEPIISLSTSFASLSGNPTSPEKLNAHRRASEQSLAHELGHMIEYRKPGVMSEAQKFLDRRLQFHPEAPQPLAALFPTGVYGPGEMGCKDHFDRLFRDRNELQDAYYTGKRYPDGATEIVSMGMETLCRNPGLFAQRDPEYFRFMLWVLGF